MHCYSRFFVGSNVYIKTMTSIILKTNTQFLYNEQAMARFLVDIKRLEVCLLWVEIRE